MTLHCIKVILTQVHDLMHLFNQTATDFLVCLQSSTNPAHSVYEIKQAVWKGQDGRRLKGD